MCPARGVCGQRSVLPVLASNMLCCKADQHRLLCIVVQEPHVGKLMYCSVGATCKSHGAVGATCRSHV
jgi:hypothetical protein